MNNFEVVSKALSQNNADINKLKTEIASKEDSFIILNTDAFSGQTFVDNSFNLGQDIILKLFNASSSAILYSQFRDYDNKTFILKPTLNSFTVDSIEYTITSCSPCVGKIINYGDTPVLCLTFLISTSTTQEALFEFFILGVSDTEITTTLSVENFNKKFEAKQDKLVSGTNIKTINGNSIVGSGDMIMENSILPLTYSELVSLRGNSQLMPGQQYRITDYVTTTSQENTRSAGNLFDIIVTAVDTNKLSELAYAIQSARDVDGYFSNSNLNGWELKYCLDNDTTRFAWADTVNGKGVIYWMKDEYDNECPYDFKNIQFKRYAVTNVTSTKLTSDALNNLKNILVKDSNGGLYFATKNSYGNFVPSDADSTSYEINENDSNWYYTFQGISSADGSTINKMYDLTVETFKLTDECISSLENDGSGADTEDYCRENKIEQFNQEYFADDIYYKGRQILNNIVFIGGLNYCYYNEEDFYWEYNTSSIYGNRFGVNCNSNTFGNDCYYNTFGNYIQNNTFGNSFSYNTFGNNCYSNTFGNSYYYNTFGNNFQNNTFGNSCYYNTFGNNCYSNTFGNYCYSNTFGNSCRYNTFGNDFSYNTFGNSCGGNTFGNYIQNNTFGNDCYSNTFGNYIQESQFGDGVQYFSITTQQMTTKPTSSYLKNYIRWLIVENGVRYVNAYVTGSTSSSSYCQNVRVCLGIQGVKDSNRKTFDITSCINSKVNNVYQPENSQTTSV